LAKVCTDGGSGPTVDALDAIRKMKMKNISSHVPTSKASRVKCKDSMFLPQKHHE
jgi:hypothetical protein